jgi:tetratricopeptide (TPR) repeat protein
LGDLDRAYQLYRSLPENHLTERAELAVQLERFEEAVELYQALLAKSPHDVKAQRNLAYALMRADRREESVTAYRRLVEAGDTSWLTRKRLAWALNALSRHDEAWQVLEVVPQPAPDPELHVLQARTAFWAGRDEEAVR